MSAAAVRLYLATTPHPAVHNAALRRRHDLLRARRPDPPVSIRRLYTEKMPFVERAHAIAGFGDDAVLASWRGALRGGGPVLPFNNYGFRETASALEAKDFAAARLRFLFFASGSQVQKGLDLLLEVFARLPHLELHVCSGFAKEPDFCACYRRELFETGNIHAVGWVDVAGERFAEIARRCACVIHPSCSEGQPGSVVQGMHAGLVPVVTRAAGLDIRGFGVEVEDDAIGALERVVLDVAERPPEWHRERAARTRAVALAEYGEDAFLARWRTILSEVVALAAPGAARP
jgi:glycosyltransferase involved in cell wall biosynthesis